MFLLKHYEKIEILRQYHLDHGIQFVKGTPVKLDGDL